MQFSGEYSFLSNFYPAPIQVLDLATFPTVEHLYQAMKPARLGDRIKVRDSTTPGAAKSMGRRYKLRNNWERIKDSVMYEALLLKFIQHPDCMKKLLSIDGVIQEGNTWGDTYWGVDLETGTGRNKLGSMLMTIREEARDIRFLNFSNPYYLGYHFMVQ